MDMSIQEIIPVYLVDGILLEDAIQFASSVPKAELLAAVLKESKSIPRETDTYPTSPTPDRPGPAQEKLLRFVKGVQDARGDGKLQPQNGGKKGYGIALDEGASEEPETADQEYTLLKEIIQLSFPRSSPDFVPSRLARSTFDSDIEQRASMRAQFSLASNSRSDAHESDTKPNPKGKNAQKHKRRSSTLPGEERQFYNLLSFLAFLVKDHLLLSPGVGEKIAGEMLRDTLSHHSSSPHSPSARRQSGDAPPWFGDGGEASIAGISLFMIIMGEELFARIRSQSILSPSTSKSASRFEDWIVHDWASYASRLQYLSLREDLGIGAREQAAEAAAVMNRV
ncbi:hypothetical protein BJX99DRAFT_45915 [Aspergillus californicus]